MNIEEIAGDTRRNAAAAVRPLPAAGFRPIQAETTQLGQRIKSNATGSLNQLLPLRLERGEGRGEVSKIFQPLIDADER